MEQKIISLNKGIYRTPSVSGDGQLSECINVIPKNGEMVNIRPAIGIGETIGTGTLIYIHTTKNEQKHYIVINNGVVKEKGNDTAIVTLNGYKDVKSIGNTLVFSDSEGLFYVLWKEGEGYKALGRKIPDINVIANTLRYFNEDGGVSTESAQSNNISFVDSSRLFDVESGIASFGDLKYTRSDKVQYINYSENSEEYSKVSTAVKSVLTNAISNASKQGLSIFPRLIRFALRMYDGTYINYTQPILVYGSSINDVPAPMPITTLNETYFVHSNMLCYYIDYYIRNIEEIKSWDDVIKGVVVFSSSEIYDIDINGNLAKIKIGDSATDDRVIPGMRSELDMNNELMNISNFYKVYDMNINEYNNVYNTIFLQNVANDKESNFTSNESITITINETESVVVNITTADNMESFVDKFKKALESYGNVYLVNKYNFQQAKKNNNKDTFTSFPYIYNFIFISKSGENVITSVTNNTTQIGTSLKKAHGHPVIPEKSTFSELTTNESISDEYFSQCTKIAGSINEYNNRITLGNIKRGVYSPSVAEHLGGNILAESIWYYLKIDGKDVIVFQDRTRMSGSRKIYDNINASYIYYPDTRCYKCVIKEVDMEAELVVGYNYYSIPMSKIASDGKNILLNGAIAVNGIPHYSFVNHYVVYPNMNMYKDSSITTDPTATTGFYEKLPNTIIQSNVNNPFVFDVDGYTNVGEGSVIGISTAAKALSEGQFGQFPLYAFCSDGIWALTISDDGHYQTVQPISRDVCVNKDSILQLDSSVAFVSDNGLNIISGSNVNNISSQMDGYNDGKEILDKFKTSEELLVGDTAYFNDMLKSCRMAYDYRNGQIHIYPSSTSNYHYIYDLQSNQYAIYNKENSSVKSIVHGYPDTILQMNNGGTLVRYSSTPRQGVQRGLILTRPVSFDNPIAMKMLSDMKTIYRKTSSGNMCSVAVYVSNDNNKWFKLTSLRSHSFKWYRFCITTTMSDNDALTGIVCRTEERRTNKIR